MDRPMVQLYMGLLAGSILYFANVYMGMFIAAAWMIVYLIILMKARFEAYLTAVILGFTLLSFINCHLYFYSNSPEKIEVVRIEAARTGYYIASHKNKTIKLFVGGSQGDKQEIQIGRKYLINGDFKSNPDYTKGISGEFYGESLMPLKEDLIYKGYKVKQELYEKVSKAIDEEGAGVILALSCGDSSYIDYSKREEFSFLGISHIISVSGLHVALIYNLLKKFTGKKISLLLLLVFVIFTGGKSSTVRAFIMIVTMSMSVNVKRRYEPISALALAAFIILLMRPYAFLDVGYVLSFLAVLSILLFNKELERKLYKLPAAINSSLSLTLSAMVLTFPYMIFIFRNVSLGGLISNLLLIPFYTYLLVAGLGLLIFFRIPMLFNISIYITTSILTIINGIEGILVDKLPLPLEFTYLQGVIILFLYLSYELIKAGVKSLKLFPIILMVLVIKESYILYPEINFISGKKADVIQVLHQDKNILISSEKVKLRNVYEDYGSIDRIYDEFEKEIIIPLSNNYIVRAVKLNGKLELYLNYRNEVIKFITKDNNTEKSESALGVFSYGNYDIIEVEKNEDTVNGRYFGTYKIVRGRSYPHYVH